MELCPSRSSACRLTSPGSPVKVARKICGAGQAPRARENFQIGDAMPAHPAKKPEQDEPFPVCEFATCSFGPFC